MNMHSAYMEKESYRPEPLPLVSTLIRLVLGISLSLAGSYVICQVILKVKAAFDNPEILKVFLALVPEDAALRTVVYQGQDIILPLASFHYMAYGVGIMLCIVAGFLGGSLLKRGITLLVP